MSRGPVSEWACTLNTHHVELGLLCTIRPVYFYNPWEFDCSGAPEAMDKLVAVIESTGGTLQKRDDQGQYLWATFETDSLVFGDCLRPLSCRSS